MNKLKPLLYVLVFLCMAPQSLSAQSVMVYYDWMMDLSVKEFMEHGRSRDYVLKINSQKRKRKYCYSDGRSVYQTLSLTKKSFTAGSRKMLLRQYTEPYFYKDFLKDSLYIIDMKNEPLTMAAVGLDGLNWQIKPDTMTIAGHPCQKALLIREGKTDLAAWFALDIPIMDGPKTFWGLPGLILEIRDSGSWVIRASSIEFGACAESLEPVFKTKISYDEYLRRRKSYGRGLTPD